MSRHAHKQAVSPGKLHKEIALAMPATDFLGVTVEHGIATMEFAIELTPAQIIQLDALVDAHDPTPPPDEPDV